MKHEYQELYIDILREEQVRWNEPMARHVTFGIGGPADCFLLPETVEQLCVIVRRAKERKIPCFILGGGANLLVRDKGIRGVVIYTGRLRQHEHDGCHLAVSSGMATTEVARLALEYGLSGLEFAAGIPGTIGGAAFMNAGAYGSEMKDVIETVTSCDREGTVHVYHRDDLDYAYRHSVFMERDEIILSVKFLLRKEDTRLIKDRMDDFNFRRHEKQPLEKKSAGSTFKRPVDHFVGQMIEESGLKGLSVGDAKVSEKHGGFLINDGQATCEDMLALIREIQKRIHDRYDVDLQLEVQIVGEK